MKNFVIFLFLASTIFSVTGFADTKNQASEEVRLVSRLLLNNPNLVSKLKEQSLTSLVSWEVKQIEQGITETKMVFTINCYCLPKTAYVTIFEDLTPTYRDASAIYKATVDIK